jgi:hypothetical protein
MRLKLAGRKHYLVGHVISDRIHCSRRFSRPRIRMHTHVTKIMTKARLEESAGGGVEWLSGRAQNIMHDWRNLRIPTPSCGLSFKQSSSAFARVALIAQGVRAARTLAL